LPISLHNNKFQKLTGTLFYAYTQLFLLFCGLNAVIIGIIYRKRLKDIQLLIVYPAASIIETTSSPYINSESPWLKEMGVPEMSANIFLLIEFLIIYHFFFQILGHKKLRRLLYAIAIIYLLSIITMWVFTETFYKNADILFVPQAICILIPTICYFFQLIKKPSDIDLRNVPAFWITTGILLYFGCTLPLFLINSILDYSVAFERNIYSINFLCYGLLFIFIIKAYLCKKTEVQ